ncbi:hypothetical protein OA92_23640 [Marinomonas sp. SBI22]|nr:hypothetical protein OA92_23640 [Marinomonas sp. SBI22]KZM38683.1 hypothetical protein OA91_23640 [Marinomonas sp. SBI8L]
MIIVFEMTNKLYKYNKINHFDLFKSFIVKERWLSLKLNLEVVFDLLPPNRGGELYLEFCFRQRLFLLFLLFFKTKKRGPKPSFSHH